MKFRSFAGFICGLSLFMLPPPVPVSLIDTRGHQAERHET